jgi:hypothetical protein
MFTSYADPDGSLTALLYESRTQLVRTISCSEPSRWSVFLTALLRALGTWTT